MTETLSRLLHDRAETVRLDPIDLDAVTRNGDRALRRRRGLGAAAAVLAVAVVGAVGVTALGGSDRRGTDVTSPPTKRGATVSWVTGTHLHGASEGEKGWSSTFDVDLGHPVSAYVRTAEGYVIAADQQLYSYVDGKLTQVDTVNGMFPSLSFRMVGDTDGSLAAWPSRLGPVVLDQTTGNLTRIPEVTQLSVIGVDGREVYVRGAQGDAIAIDVDTQEATPIEGFNQEANGHDSSLVQAEDGTFLGYDATGALASTTAAGGSVALGPYTSAVTLSPTGRWAVSGEVMNRGDGSAYDLRDGSRVTLPTDSWLAYPYEWLDDDTVVLLSLETENANYRLLTCVVSEPSCQVAVPDLGEARYGRSGNGVHFTLPIGAPYFPFPHG